MHPLAVLLIVAVAAWLLATFVSGTLAAIVVIVGVVYVLLALLPGSRW